MTQHLNGWTYATYHLYLFCHAGISRSKGNAVATSEASLVVASGPAMTYAGGRYTWEGLMRLAQEQHDKGCPQTQVGLVLVSIEI